MLNTRSEPLGGGLGIASPQAGHYVIRPVRSIGAVDPEAARAALRARLLAGGPGDERVTVTFADDPGIRAMLADGHGEIESLGWEGLIVPGASRRTVRMPRGFTAEVDATAVSEQDLVRVHARSAAYLSMPYLDLAESVLVRRDGAVVGWVPVCRPTRLTSAVRVTAIREDILDGPDEERRRTHLRLAVYAHAVSLQCDRGRSVLTWMPDSGDPVNQLKLAVSGAIDGTHWCQVSLRRDLGRPEAP